MTTDEPIPPATPPPPALPDVEQESPEEIIAGAPSIEEIVEGAESAQDVLAAQPSVDELLGRAGDGPSARPPNDAT
jgi:hypothetical protein